MLARPPAYGFGLVENTLGVPYRTGAYRLAALRIRAARSETTATRHIAATERSLEERNDLPNVSARKCTEKCTHNFSFSNRLVKLNKYDELTAHRQLLYESADYNAHTIVISQLHDYLSELRAIFMREKSLPDLPEDAQSQTHQVT